MAFNRGLDDAFIGALQREAKEDGWWAAVLKDPTLLIGVRENYLNVYWQGQALFTARLNGETLEVTTHEKFLLDPDLDSQVGLAGGKFGVSKLQANGFMAEFRAGETLAKMKRAAGRFAGSEKKGCHVIAQKNPAVVDCEVAFPADRAGADNGTNRVDLACFEEHNGGVRLVFWEAKHFSNKELRAQQADAPVMRQINGYVDWIRAHRTELETSYRRIARNLLAIKAMGWTRDLHPLIQAVADRPELLALADTQSVGLLVFGFDRDQRDGAVWGEHRKKLEQRISRVVPVGNAAGLRLPTRANDAPTESPTAEPTTEADDDAG